MDLTPLVTDDALEPLELWGGCLERSRHEVSVRLANLWGP